MTSAKMTSAKKETKKHSLKGCMCVAKIDALLRQRGEELITSL